MGCIPIFPAWLQYDLSVIVGGANGVRLVLLALLTTACANVRISDNANNASLTPL